VGEVVSKSKHNIWQWADIGAGSSNSHAPADSFQGRDFHKEIINLIREAVQNTLDATDPNNQAKISFKYMEPYRNCSEYFKDLTNFINISNRKEENPEDISDQDFSEPDFILIQDFGTGGIQGSLSDERNSPIWNFILDWGLSNKEGAGNLGSKGQGRQSFLLASRIETIFFITYKKTQRILAGLSFLNPYQSGDAMYDSQAVFAKASKGVVYDLHSGSSANESEEDTWFINKFEHSFQIGREKSDEGEIDPSQTGTAIIIPLPKRRVKESFHDFAIASAIQNFAPAILREKLSVQVGETSITHQNISQLAVEKSNFFSKHTANARQFKQYAPEFLAFLSDTLEVLETPEAGPTLTLSYDENELVTFDEDTFTRKHKQLVRDTLLQKNLVIVRFEFTIKRKASLRNEFIKVDSYVDASIGICQSGHGIEMYSRAGMTMPKQDSMIGRGKYHAVMLCNEPNISDLLNASEDTGHTCWNHSSSTIRKKGFDQDTASKIVQLCETALGKIVNSCLEDSAEEDSKALDHLFMFDLGDLDTRAPDPEDIDPESDPDNENPDDDDPWDPDDDDWNRKKIFYSIAPNESGFSVRHIPDMPIGESIILQPEYAQDIATGRRSNSNNFDFIDNQIAISTSNCNAIQNLDAEGKLKIDVSNMRDGFEVEITGFNIDLELDLRHNIQWGVS
jgi:hypothetical protein